MNSGPFWFPDTSTYIRGADAAFYAVTGQKSDWSNRIDEVAPPIAATPTMDVSTDIPRGEDRKIVLAGRSIYYGMLIFIPMAILGPWAAACVQSLITAFVIVFSISIVLRHRITPESGNGMGFPRDILPYAALCIISLLTPLAYYANMLMPDIFAGLLCLIMPVAIIFWPEMTRLEKVVAVGLCCTFATFHTTILLLAIAVSGAAFIFHRDNRVKVRSVVLGMAIAVVSVIAGTLFAISVEKTTGQRPMSPPFLTARITAAGPGTEYLNNNCNNATTPFAICRHIKKLPMDSDNFLWGEDDETSLFKVLPAAEQRQISSEDKRFYLTVLADSPIKVIGSALSNGLEVLGLFGLENFNYPHRVMTNIQEYPDDVWTDIIKTRAAINAMPVKTIEISSIVIVIISTISILGILLNIYPKKFHISPRVMQFSLLICVAVLANAMICGALSKPHSRYQARLIWLLPLAASLLVASSRRSQEKRKDGSHHQLSGPEFGLGK